MPIYSSLWVVGIDLAGHFLPGTHYVDSGHREESTVSWHGVVLGSCFYNGWKERSESSKDSTTPGYDRFFPVSRLHLVRDWQNVIIKLDANYAETTVEERVPCL